MHVEQLKNAQSLTDLLSWASVEKVLRGALLQVVLNALFPRFLASQTEPFRPADRP